MSGRVLFVLVAVIVFVADRITKGLVVANVQPGTEKQVLPHVWITNTQNPGAAFGVAQDATAVFLVASVVVTVGLVFYVARNPVGTWAGVLLGLILGGTVGNGYDRLLHGTVTDFIALHFWPVFNVADSAISVGVVILLLGYVIRQRSGSSG
jgi:signal peptidase II